MEQANAAIIQPTKQFWISNLRILATISVVFIHTSGGALFKFGKIANETWWAANIINGFGRFTVPVFVMISGALLLGKEIELFSFLQKRFLRIWVPFTVWVVIYIAYHNIFEHNPINIKNAFLGYLTGGNGQYGHLWFVYMILGLYLFTPIINYFIQKATETEIVYLLIICFISTTIFQLFKELLKLNIKLDIGNFGGYLGYYVAGYYLKNKCFNINKYWFLFMFIFAYLATILGSYWLSSQSGKFTKYFYDYFSPNSVLMTLSIFMLFKETFKKEFLPKIMGPVDKASFGIYLAHLLIINILSRKFAINWAWHPPIIGIITHASLAFIISFILVWILGKLPFGKWLIG
jgi:surface polysaccharide O-acyltransferase-like enzyme